ncbi:MAG: OadG family protein [Phycisphaeraceae bacterium]
MSTYEAMELGLTFAVVGMLVVFAVLSVLALVIAGLNRWSDRLDARTAEALDPQVVVVLAAAATTALGRPVRVRDLKVHDR